MQGQILVARGDLTELAVDAVGYSASTGLSGSGQMYRSFEANITGFADWFARLDRDRPARIGDAFWYDMPSSCRPYGVVVVASAGRERTEEDKASLAVRAAIETAVARLRERFGPHKRLLIALPAFRTGMGGDHAAVYRSARAQILAAQQALEGHSRVDVAFVAYTPSIHRVFLEARRSVRPTPVPSGGIPDELVRVMAAGSGVAFVGAGLSRGAGLADWDELIGVLAEGLGLDPKSGFDHLDVAQWYRERHGDEALRQVLARQIGEAGKVARPTLAHYLLLSLPLRLVFTTNYDDLIERALIGLKRYPVRVVHEADVARTGLAEGTCVVKLHGDPAASSEIVLCRDDYDEYFVRRPAMALLLQGLLLNHGFLFVGYSLRDPNFRSIYGEVGRMLRDAQRPAYSLSYDAGGPAGTYLAEQWRRKRLELIPIECEDREAALLAFLDRLSEEVSRAEPAPLLAADAEVPQGLRDLRALLIGPLADEVERLCGGPITDSEEAGYLARVLTFLTSLGWRPAYRGDASLCRHWERLAEVAPTPADRHAWLMAALEVSERHEDAARVRKALDGWGSHRA